MKRFAIEIEEFNDKGEVISERTDICESNDKQKLYNEHLYLMGRKYAFKRKGWFKIRISEMLTTEYFDGDPKAKHTKHDDMILGLAKDAEKEHKKKMKNFKIEGI